MKQDYLKILQKKFLNTIDVVYRQIYIKDKICNIVFLKSMIDENLLSEYIIKPILAANSTSMSVIKNKILISEIEEKNSFKEVESAVLINQVVIFFNGEQKALAVNIEKYPKRTPSEPPTSSVIQGPREGFTEDYKTNITLLRRRFPTNNFKLQSLNIGEYTKTKIIICYLDGIADKKMVSSIKKRLQNIKVDGIIDSYNLVGYLQEHNASLFKQVGSAEKPDIVAAKMLEGRVAIICDGSPIVLTLPFVYLEDIQNSNDYYTNMYYASFIRIIRAFGILIATVVPGIYLAVRLYHYKVVPLKYTVTIANSTENLPFTPFIEILFILVLFQILYEVSLRLPQYLGLATSIVGALILGDTGVKAGLISPPTVIIIALSIISIYTVPDQSPQFTVLRFVFIMVGGCLGILGISAVLIYVINYCNELNAYGAPYLAPFAPLVRQDLKDSLVKQSFNKMINRPKSFHNEDIKRRGDG